MCFLDQSEIESHVEIVFRKKNGYWLVYHAFRARSVRKNLDIEVALSYAGNQLKRPLSRKRLDLAQAFGSHCYYTLKHTKFYGLSLLSSSMLSPHQYR